VAVLQRDAESRVGQHLVHGALHFNQFFLGQTGLLAGVERAAPKPRNADRALLDGAALPRKGPDKAGAEIDAK